MTPAKTKGNRMIRKSIVTGAVLAVVPFALFAQGTTDPNGEITTAALNWVLGIIPLAVPILVAVGKRIVSALPSWSLPVIAAGLGAAIDGIAGLASDHQSNVILATLLGSAGVGLREIVDQIGKLIAPKE